MKNPELDTATIDHPGEVRVLRIVAVPVRDAAPCGCGIVVGIINGNIVNFHRTSNGEGLIFIEWGQGGGHGHLPQQEMIRIYSTVIRKLSNYGGTEDKVLHVLL